VLCGILALARDRPRRIHQQAARRWQHVPVAEVAGDTLGIIGLGAIGQAIARRGRACGMQVIGTRRTAEPVPGVDEVYGPEGLETVLRRSRWVVLACPLTPETHGLIGARELDWIGDGYLINIGRGALVDENALTAALQAGRLGGAMLDVFRSEEHTSELQSRENLVCRLLLEKKNKK